MRGHRRRDGGAPRDGNENGIVEAKAIKELTDVDRAQAINYLMGTGVPRAVLLNIGAAGLPFERLVNRFVQRGG